jgi:hypothetical protein
LIAAFSLHLVKTGILPADLGRTLNRVERIRLLADYTGEEIDRDRATWAVEQATAFVQAITQHISAIPPMRPLFTIDFLAEILVAGNDNPMLHKGFLKDLLIINAARRLVNGKHLMALAAQPTGH